MKSLPALCTLLLICVLIPPTLLHAEETSGDGVVIKADQLSYDKENNTYNADGKVEIIWDGNTIRSDTAQLNQTSGTAQAEGAVRLLRGNDVLNCDRLVIDLNTELGEAHKADLFVKNRNFRIRGKKFEKVGEEEYRMEEGEFTTCDGEKPSWKFTARQLDVTLQEYATGKDAVFYLSDIPVFYLPYLLFPVNKERQSGFLFPRIGNSSKKGFILNIPYYWAISPSQEATVDLDVQTRRGVGMGIDYRYLRPRESSGMMRGYYIYDFQKDKSRGSLVTRQIENLDAGISFRSDVHMAMDRDFLKDYGEISGQYNRQYLESRAALSWKHDTSLLTGDIRYVNDLDAQNNNETLQKLPSITFLKTEQRLVPSFPLFWSLYSDFTQFTRQQGIQGERLTIQPNIRFSTSLPAGLHLTMAGGYGVRGYNSYSGENSRDSFGNGYTNASTRISLPLVGIHDVEWGNLTRVRNFLVPEVSYSYVESANQTNLPFFDYVDRIAEGQIVSWSLTSYLTGKFLGADSTSLQRDLGYIRLSQQYQLQGTRRDLLTLVDEGRRFTDLWFEAQVTPIKKMTINMDSRFNTYQGRFLTNNIGINFDDENKNLFSVAYRFSRGEIEYLEGKIGIALLKPYLFTYSARYSLNKGGFLESVLDLEYRHQCWSLILSYRERPDSRDVTANFAMSGIGSMGKIKLF